MCFKGKYRNCWILINAFWIRLRFVRYRFVKYRFVRYTFRFVISTLNISLISKTSWRRLEYMSSRRFQDVLWDIFKTPSRRLGRQTIVMLKMCWSCLQDMSWRPTNVCLATEQKRGGFTYCVRFCYNNSKVSKGLSFYVIQKEPALRKEWLHMRCRKNFNPASGHGFCSDHFVGGKKTYKNNFPTIVPKQLNQ